MLMILPGYDSCLQGLAARRKPFLSGGKNRGIETPNFETVKALTWSIEESLYMLPYLVHLQELLGCDL
jgi:hypothetical protein